MDYEIWPGSHAYDSDRQWFCRVMNIISNAHYLTICTVIYFRDFLVAAILYFNICTQSSSEHSTDKPTIARENGC